MTKTRLKTRQEARDELVYKGISVSKWARDNGFDPGAVLSVLCEDAPCNYGERHKIAVTLGIKRGVIVVE